MFQRHPGHDLTDALLDVSCESVADIRESLRAHYGRPAMPGPTASTPGAPGQPPGVVRAFLAEAGGKTILTVSAFTRLEQAQTPNPHFLWLQGAFVGAERANRNGAFWSTADLRMGEPTVKHGPLNWLHEWTSPRRPDTGLCGQA